MEYHVLLDINCGEFPPGSTIDLDEAAAQPLLDEGVISTDPMEKIEVHEPVEEEQKVEPIVAGAPIDSGEPALDGTQAAQTSTTDAKDVTPVLEDMTRSELEAHAADKGIDPAVVAAAPNKAAVVDLINVVPADLATDPSANL